MPGSRGRSLDSATLWTLAGITIVGLALRLPSFGNSLWADELSTNFVVNGFGAGSIIHIVLGPQEGTPPLFFLLTSLTKGIDGPEGLRIVSLAAGLASIPLTFLLGDRTVGRPAALTGAALIALSPFQIFYATEARAYELTMFFCLLAALALLIAIDSGRLLWWVVYGLSVAGAAYSHYTGVFVLIAIFAWAFLARPAFRLPLMLANLGAALLYVPWIPELLDDRHEPAANLIAILEPMTPHNMANDLLHLSLGHPDILLSEVPGHLAIWLMGAAAALGAVSLAVRLREHGRERWWPMPGGLVYVLILAFAAPVGAALSHLFGPTIFASRNIIESAPGLALSAGVLVTAGRAPLRLAATGLLLAGFAIGGAKMLDANNQRPDYAGPVHYIEDHGPSSAPIVDAFTLTPGAQTALEAALAPKGEAFPQGRQTFTFQIPTLADRLAIRRTNRQQYGAGLPIPTERQIAKEAVAAAAGSGPIFLLAGKETPALLRTIPGAVANFLKALPPRYKIVASRTFSGLGYTRVTVYTLRPAPADMTG